MSRANPPRVTFYVVLFPQPPDSGAAIRPISRLLKVEEEDARAMLLTKSFQVLARYAKRANAEGLQNQLGALGVETLIVSDQDIRGHLFVYASGASKGAGGIAFRDFDDKPLYTPFEDIIGAVFMEVVCEDGSSAVLIDLHRKSAAITPRLDANLFDFGTLMGAPGSTIEDFLAELETKSHLKVNRKFADRRDQITKNALDFGSRPTEFTPPAEKIKSAYDQKQIIGAALWSFLLYQQEVAQD